MKSLPSWKFKGQNPASIWQGFFFFLHKQQQWVRSFWSNLCCSLVTVAVGGKSTTVPPASARNDGCRSHEQVWDLRGQLGLGRRLLLHPHFRCISQVHQRLPLRALLKVLAANAFTNGRAHDLCLRVEMKRNISMLRGEGGEILFHLTVPAYVASRENPPHSTRSSSSDSPTVCSCSLCCADGRTLPLCLYRSWAWRPLGSGPGMSAKIKWHILTSVHPSDFKAALMEQLARTALPPYLYGFQTFRFMF